MKRTLYSFVTAILLVPLFGVQAMAQDYKLPDNSGIITMSEILRENPSLKGKPIYGDIERDDNGSPSSPPNIYGGQKPNGESMLNDEDKYGTANPDITFTTINGLTLISNTGEPIEKAILYLAKFENKDWWIDTTRIILERQNSAENPQDEASDTAKGESTDFPGSNSKPNQPYPWWTWFLCGFLFGVVLSLILKRKLKRKTMVPQTKIPTDEEDQVRDGGKQPDSGEKSLNKSDVEQIANRIAEKYSSDLFKRISKLVDEKLVSLRSESRVQNNTTSNVSTSTRNVKETRNVHTEETEEFCGYAQLPQNGELALTITQDPTRTAFVINKKGFLYYVGLIDDEQTLSQLVQPLSDLKVNGSNIVDFPEGELQGAQKIVCVERGIFKEESNGKIIAIKPIQIKRG